MGRYEINLAKETCENKETVVNLLLSVGASTDRRDAVHGQTALFWA